MGDWHTVILQVLFVFWLRKTLTGIVDFLWIPKPRFEDDLRGSLVPVHAISNKSPSSSHIFVFHSALHEDSLYKAGKLALCFQPSV